jgi:hypothetical protein
VPDFEKFTKNSLHKIQKQIFSGYKLPLPVAITAQKIFIENGLNDQKNKLKFSLPKKI